MAIAFTYTESTNLVVVTGGTSGTPATFADFVAADRTVATSACTIASGANLKAATAIAASTDLTLTYPVRPVEFKGLRLAITTAANGGAAASGDETVDIYGTTPIWCYMTGASASGQKVVPVANLTHLFQVGDTVILIDISAPATYETDTIASISEGVSITLTNNNTNSYAALDVVGIYQTEQINTSAAHGTFWTTLPYGQVAKLTFTGYDGTNTGKVDQPIWGVIWNLANKSYKVVAKFNIGDASTSTYFTTKEESVIFPRNITLTMTASATFTSGQKTNSTNSSKGSTLLWDVENTATEYWMISALAGTFNLYDTSVSCINITSAGVYTGNVRLEGATSELIGCKFSGLRSFRINSGTNTINYLSLNGMKDYNIYWKGGTNTVSNIVGSDIGVYAMYIETNGADITLSNAAYLSAGTTKDFYIGSRYNGNAYLIDCTLSDWDVANADTTYQNSSLYRRYSCNINICDKAGAAISGATVLCEDKDGTDVFSVSTDASGNIVQQNVNYRRYYYSVSELVYTYSPHKFTISKAGYETLVLDAITVDSPIDWHLELQDPTIDIGATLLELNKGNLVKVLTEKTAMTL